MTEPIRFFYRTEVEDGVERVFTIAYIHNIETGETKYGGTVFRHSVDDRKETFRKAPHRHTAEKRLKVRPVNLIVKGNNFAEVENSIRLAIREFGVSGKRIA